MVAIEDTIRLWLAREGYGKKLGYGIRQASKAQRRGEANLTGIRAKLAEQLRTAEQLTPAANLREFNVDHAQPGMKIHRRDIVDKLPLRGQQQQQRWPQCFKRSPCPSVLSVHYSKDPVTCCAIGAILWRTASPLE